eukprot:Platyproteum_vivax@DN7493_c0_g1_i4.p1
MATLLVIMNLLRGDIARLPRCKIVTGGDAQRQELEKGVALQRAANNDANNKEETGKETGDTAVDETETVKSPSPTPARNRQQILLRGKPLMFCFEKEIVMYAYLQKLDYFSTECTYSVNADRGYVRNFIKQIEIVNAQAILDILVSADNLHVRTETNMPSLQECTRCGLLSSGSVCKACVLLEGLIKKKPLLGLRRHPEKKLAKIEIEYEGNPKV